MSVLRRSMMRKKAGGVLPSGYTQLEYITNPSTAYINTGVKMSEATSVRIVMQASNSSFFLMGQNSANNTNALFIMHSLQQWYSRPSSSFGIADGNKHDITLANGVVTCDGTVRTFAGGTVNNDSRILICGAWSGTSVGQLDSRRMQGKIYKVEIVDTDNTLTFNGIPAQDSNNAIGLYDTVSQSFFTSASDVEFTTT